MSKSTENVAKRHQMMEVIGYVIVNVFDFMQSFGWLLENCSRISVQQVELPLVREHAIS